MALPWKDHRFGTGKSAAIGLLNISVVYDTTRSKDDKRPPYTWEINGYRSKNSYSTMEQAEQAALAHTKKLLQQTIEALEES